MVICIMCGALLDYDTRCIYCETLIEDGEKSENVKKVNNRKPFEQKLDKILNELYKRTSTYLLLSLVLVFFIIPTLTATIYCRYNTEASWNNTYLFVLIFLVYFLVFLGIGVFIYIEEWKKKQ